MATVQDLVVDALLEINAISVGETLGAEDGESGLRTLNRMINGWKAERVFLSGNFRITWNIVAGDDNYSFGVGGDINAARPVQINAVKYIDTAITPGVEVNLRLMTDQDWNSRRVPDQTATYPQAAWYNKLYPLGAMRLWPVPTSATLQGVVYYPQVVGEFAALATAVSLDYGYERMIVKNLALELAPQYGANVSDELRRQAQDSMAVVMRMNRRLQEIRFSPDAGMSRGAYDIWSDVP